MAEFALSLACAREDEIDRTVAAVAEPWPSRPQLPSCDGKIGALSKPLHPGAAERSGLRKNSSHRSELAADGGGRRLQVALRLSRSARLRVDVWVRRRITQLRDDDFAQPDPATTRHSPPPRRHHPSTSGPTWYPRRRRRPRPRHLRRLRLPSRVSSRTTRASSASTRGRRRRQRGACGDGTVTASPPEITQRQAGSPGPTAVPVASLASGSSSRLLLLLFGIGLALSLIVVGIALTPPRALPRPVGMVVYEQRDSLVWAGITIAVSVGLALLIFAAS